MGIMVQPVLWVWVRNAKNGRGARQVGQTRIHDPARSGFKGSDPSFATSKRTPNHQDMGCVQ